VSRLGEVSSEPEALVAFFEALGFAVKQIGLEAGPLSQWLFAGLKRAGFDTVLLETRHVKAALSAMTVKTDRKDARGLAQLIRMGWFRPVHTKSMGSQEVRALLVARKQLLGRLIDVELSIPAQSRFLCSVVNHLFGCVVDHDGCFEILELRFRAKDRLDRLFKGRAMRLLRSLNVLPEVNAPTASGRFIE